MLFGVTSYKPFQTVERIFLGVCLMANLIVSGTFQGSLTTSFSTTSFYKDIDTLHELDASELPIGTSSKSLSNMFGDKDIYSPLIASLQSKFHVLSGVPIITRTSTTRDICCVERYNDIKIIIAVRSCRS